MVVAVAGMVGLAALFRFTAIGLRMRAVVESPRMTELNGIRADRVSAFSWALSSLFAGMAGVLIAPRFNTLAAPDFFNLVVVAVAAAAVGQLVSLPAGADRRARPGHPHRRWSTPSCPGGPTTTRWLEPIQDNLTPAMPFVVLFGVLVLLAGDPGHPRSTRPARRGSTRHPRRSPPRPARPASPAPPGSSPSCFFVVAGFVVFTQADPSWLFLVTQAVILSTIFLSITVITGFAGADLAVPGHLRRHRRLHGVPARRPLRHVGAGRRRSIGAVIAAVVGAAAVAPAAAARRRSGWPSPRWPSPTSSTP